MTSFDIQDCAPDVQAYIYSKWLAADNPMYAGERYINTLGIEYNVLEDSPAGEDYVKVKCSHNFGYSIREIPKVILCS